jgi:hypothetical protein
MPLLALLAAKGCLLSLYSIDSIAKLRFLEALSPSLGILTFILSYFLATGSWFNRFDPDLILRRQVWLEEYLCALLRVEQCETCKDLFKKAFGHRCAGAPAHFWSAETNTTHITRTTQACH